MQGVPFRVDGRGRVLISWMSRARAYWSVSGENGKRFSAPVATPDHNGEEAYPVAVANSKGEVLLVWKQGQQVHWALYGMDGRFSGTQGQAGELPTKNKPNAFVGADDQFYVVF
jgi:hypothetical protein